ncbi:MAG: dUTP diphosphatase [Flavobacteriales bacterium]|nr:dUTP diphosphatase [Flavobacteriales bacterium]
MEIKVVNTTDFELPKHETEQSAGVDLRANESAILKPLQRQLICTGLFMELPQGFEAQIRPRSGLALKHGITVLNSPGTIDADYRGEIKVLLINLGENDFELKKGERIAQMIVSKYKKIKLKETNQISETSRGAGGYGSTGKN